jgi:nucleoside-diphosphate-sugar epimerase
MPPDERATFAINRDATERLLADAEACGVRRFVYVSSCAVYGDADHELLSEDAPRAGTDAYARSKAAAEDLVVEWGKGEGRAGYVLRPCAITGPGDRNLAPAVRALVGLPEVTLPDGAARRLDVVDARDLAGALEAALFDTAGKGGTYNVTGGLPMAGRALLEQVARAAGTAPRWSSLPLREARALLLSAAERGESPPFPPALLSFCEHHRTYSIERAERELGYRPDRSVHPLVRAVA